MDRLKDVKRELLLKAKAVTDAATREDRALSVDEKAQIEGYFTEIAGIGAKMEAREADNDLRAQIEAMGAGMPEKASKSQVARLGGGPLGKTFVDSPEFQAMVKHHGGTFTSNSEGMRTGKVFFNTLFGQKTLLTGDSVTSAGAFVETDYTGIYEPLGRIPLNVRGLISLRTTGSDLVEFVRQVTQVDEATTVAEANVTDYAAATGEVSGEKPEGAMTFEQVTAAVKTIAVWIPATKRALSDAAQIRGIIDQELTDDLNEELEEQIINGDGTGENMTGILNTSGILTQAWDTDLLTTARKAKTTLMVSGKSMPTAWMINPADWETIELLQDGNDRYYWGGPLTNGQPSLWGVPVVENQTIDEGTGILADWRKAVMWDRERSSIQVSDSHEDFFIRNMVAFLAELRAAFGLIRPSAFVEVALESGT